MTNQNMKKILVFALLVFSPSLFPTQHASGVSYAYEVPIYIQRGAMDCGPTCLRMVMSLYGKDLRSDQVNIASITFGTPAERIEHFAKENGFDVLMIKNVTLISEIKSLMRKGPLLIGGTIPEHWPCHTPTGAGHWIVLTGCTEKDTFIINEPFCGKAFEITYQTFKRFIIRDRPEGSRIIESEWSRTHSMSGLFFNRVIQIYPKEKVVSHTEPTIISPPEPEIKEPEEKASKSDLCHNPDGTLKAGEWCRKHGE